MAKSRPLIGILFMVVFNLQTAVVDGISKYLTQEIHPLEVAWGYFAAIFLFILGYSVIARIPPRRILATRRPVMQILRAAMLVFTITTLFIGLAYIPLADITAITFSSPLIITALSAPILGERVGIHRWAAVVVGMTGVLIIIRPGGEVMHWAVIMPCLTAVGFAAFQIATRVMAATESTFTTMFYTSAGGFALTSAMVVFVWTPLDMRQTAILLAIGALGASAHFCLIKAFAEAQASFLAPFNYTKLIWVTILGYLLFADIPAPHVILGSLIIIASGLYVLLRERRQMG